MLDLFVIWWLVLWFLKYLNIYFFWILNFDLWLYKMDGLSCLSWLFFWFVMRKWCINKEWMFVLSVVRCFEKKFLLIVILIFFWVSCCFIYLMWRFCSMWCIFFVLLIIELIGCLLFRVLLLGWWSLNVGF